MSLAEGKPRLSHPLVGGVYQVHQIDGYSKYPPMIKDILGSKILSISTNGGTARYPVTDSKVSDFLMASFI